MSRTGRSGRGRSGHGERGEPGRDGQHREPGNRGRPAEPRQHRRAASCAIALALLALQAPAPAAPAPAEEASSSEAPAGTARRDGLDWAREREFWSFRAPEAPPLPAVKDGRWSRRPLDAFVLAHMEAAGLSPSPEADRRTWIRRASFDLIGLPPAPEEVEAFLGDPGEGAYERLVERLLASPRFGERLASLWLPLARYAEDQAHQVGSDTKFFYPNAYRFREWVIDAFNRDVPYDRFIKLQLAADTLPGARPEDLAALGFLGLGPKYYGRGRLDVMADEWEDRVDTVTRTMLGLTVACARCHDHKFEAVTTADYHALAGVFASTRMINRTPEGKVEKSETSASQMDCATLHIVEDGEVQDLPVFLRGNVDRKGPVVPRGLPRLLSGGESTGEPTAFKEGSGRRELAEAIAGSRNPLTARVMVNRLWGILLGRPLVATPSNFGRSGSTPSHPELLDHLAVQFMENGWSVKALVREIVLSSTYRQASREDPGRVDQRGVDQRGVNQPGVQQAGAAVDPTNQLLWRMNRRRQAVEQWRDAVLLACGQLEWVGGPSLELSDPRNLRRTVHARISRLELDAFLLRFDYPDANVHSEGRAATTTPAQKLFLMNSPFMIERARALSARLHAERPGSDEERVRRAYLLLFAREPGKEELDLAREYLGGPAAEGMSPWESYAQALLASSEMSYVD